MDNTPVSNPNPNTNAGATLGRVLFFDTRLSANDGTSCGSSHNQAVAFGHTPALSLGFNGALTTRHSPSLDNARFYKRGRFFWDKRAATLEAQVLGPIQNSGVWQPGDQRRSCVCCANCHTTVAQVMDSTHNTGLDASRVNIGPATVCRRHRRSMCARVRATARRVVCARPLCRNHRWWRFSGHSRTQALFKSLRDDSERDAERALLRRDAKQPALRGVFDQPERAIRRDGDVANLVTHHPAFGGCSATLFVERDAAE